MASQFITSRRMDASRGIDQCQCRLYAYTVLRHIQYSPENYIYSNPGRINIYGGSNLQSSASRVVYEVRNDDWHASVLFNHCVYFICFSSLPSFPTYNWLIMT